MTKEVVPTPDDPLLTTADIGKILAVNPYTVRTWIHEGKLSAIKLPGGELRVQQSEMVRFVNSRYGDK